ncbi:MAG: hypothetical protein HGB12_17575, partial [Bacteroidetes bacterium]|nr:hypothetical protein [Bacteroidota bacterium]
TDWSGTNEGQNLKVIPVCGSLPCWNSPNTGATNNSGFTALPSGLSWSGAFNDVGYSGHWWSSTESGTDAWERALHYSIAMVYRNNNDKANGYSIRCVKNN